MQSSQATDAIFTIVVIMCLLEVCQALPLQPTDKLVRVTLLDSTSDPRVRREAGTNLPDQLTFGLPVHDTDVVLHLTRASLLKTVTCDPQGTEDTSRGLVNAAVYRDTSLGAVMVVKMAVGGYTLKGSLMQANQEWTLEPHDSSNSNQSGLGTAMHKMCPMRSDDTISFVGDSVIDSIVKKDHPEIIHNTGLVREKRTTRERHYRHRRAAIKHTVEMTIVADYADFTKWVTHFGETTAIQEMRLWYTYVAESVNARYRSIQDAEISLSVAVTLLKILNNAQSSTFISSLQNSAGVIDGTDGLNAFKSWYPAQWDIPSSDHYMLFTGLDIRGASGIAFNGQLCTASAVSICENSFTGSVGGVAAHELAHSLSAVHDADTRGKEACTDDDQFIMSAIFRTPVSPGNEGNPWKFSPCSIQSFKSYLPGVSCTLPENTRRENTLPAALEGQRAGEVLSRDAQCRLSFRDARSSFCQLIQESSGGMAGMCGGMFCSIPDGRPGSCSSIVPQEFTPCGPGEWCVTGECVRKTEEAPATTATTAQTTTEWHKTSAGTTQTTATTAQTTTEWPKTSAGTTQTTATTATNETTATTATNETTATTVTTQTTAPTASTYFTSTPPITNTALLTPTTHKYKQVRREEPTPRQKHTMKSHLGTTTPSTEDRRETPTATTTQAENCCRPLKTSFRQCLDYSSRKDFVNYWNCLV